MYGNENLMQAL